MYRKTVWLTVHVTVNEVSLRMKVLKELGGRGRRWHTCLAIDTGEEMPVDEILDVNVLAELDRLAELAYEDENAFIPEIDVITYRGKV